MRQATFSLAILSLSLCASAQPRSSDTSTQSAIRYVKTLLTSSFDSRLPRITLEDFLSYETGSARGKWTIVECQKRTASTGDQASQDRPTCVQVDYDVKPTENLDCPHLARDPRRSVPFRNRLQLGLFATVIEKRDIVLYSCKRQ